MSSGDYLMTINDENTDALVTTQVLALVLLVTHNCPYQLFVVRDAAYDFHSMILITGGACTLKICSSNSSVASWGLLDL